MDAPISANFAHTGPPSPASRPGPIMTAVPAMPSPMPDVDPVTVVVAVVLPAVLVYQGWTYWVFRRRIDTRHIPVPARRADGTAGRAATNTG